MKTLRFFFLSLIPAVTPAWVLCQRPEPNEFVALDKQPSELNLSEVKRSIVFPPEALDSAVSGKVFVKVLVDESGKVVEHQIVKSAHKTLSQAVESRIYDLRFSPGERDGKPVAAWVTIPFQFTIQEPKPLALNDRLPVPLNLAEIVSLVKAPKGVAAPDSLVVGVHVSQTGSPLEIRYPPNTSPEWKTALEKHLYDLKFQPAVVFDQPRAMWTNVKLDLTKIGKGK